MSISRRRFLDASGRLVLFTAGGAITAKLLAGCTGDGSGPSIDASPSGVDGGYDYLARASRSLPVRYAAAEG